MADKHTPSYGGKTVFECQHMILKSFQNPTVRFLREHMEKAGCHVGDKFFKAVNCELGHAGGYNRGQGIFVCSNNIESQDQVNVVVIHELIHAFDECRATNVKWTNCAHHACTEIRAYHLSGECHYKWELLRGFLKIRGHEHECIRRKVMQSLSINPFCAGATAKDSMEAVWDICYNDTEPFERAP